MRGEYVVLVTLNQGLQQVSLFDSYKSAKEFLEDWQKSIELLVKEGDLSLWEVRLCEVVYRSLGRPVEPKRADHYRSLPPDGELVRKAKEGDVDGLLDLARRSIVDGRLESLRRRRGESAEEDSIG